MRNVIAFSGNGAEATRLEVGMSTMTQECNEGTVDMPISSVATGHGNVSVAWQALRLQKDANKMTRDDTDLQPSVDCSGSCTCDLQSADAQMLASKEAHRSSAH